ncbi:aryl-alcohol dehydrogenase-like predicted oxidoreductase [Herbihabitans rhizosphaerae]|uniref:Aryl-alcohol dehydrogenase-like predicted oxidoreductase n=1 Tax=Herbihabitans rhizosphaerae TaxID=1872711 RepID=A0A4Q7KG71_9PSEU|nr:aldo/keto reductase [Herbihabitans rhizosphaerae]RZS34232.1 aryl-alcohol dehydrogenase-like predicted oxidoreductase [Herbihabitans rhizosphaerae]
MRTTPLGRTGLTASAQGFGCMRLDDARPESEKVVHHALDLGVTFLDTAAMYGTKPGDNELLVGRALRTRRAEALLCTKFGVELGDGWWKYRGDRDYVHASCEASLRRLGTDVIDLYYLHHRIDEVPIEETVGAMGELVAAGKVRHLGLSNITVEDLRRAHATHAIAAIQPEWSLIDRAIEGDLVPVCAELGVGVVPYCPQGRGQLFAEPAVRRVASRNGIQPGQAALAWIHSRASKWGVEVVPIPGTTRVSHLDENAAAVGIALSDADLAELEESIVKEGTD